MGHFFGEELPNLLGEKLPFTIPLYYATYPLLSPHPPFRVIASQGLILHPIRVVLILCLKKDNLSDILNGPKDLPLFRKEVNIQLFFTVIALTLEKIVTIFLTQSSNLYAILSACQI